MKLPRTRNSWTERRLIDDAFDAYLGWRAGGRIHEGLGVRSTAQRSTAAGVSRNAAFRSYLR
jgi:hypothetical protein